MAIGVVAVLLNASLFVFNVFNGADINKLLCNSLSALSVCLVMYAFYRYNRSVKNFKEALAMLKDENDAKFDHENNVGRYYVGEFSDKFAVLKSCAPHYYIFIVRTFPFTEGDDESRKKARLRAYSLLNHITDNGKLWSVSKV